MPRAGFELAIPKFERPKTDRAAIETDIENDVRGRGCIRVDWIHIAQDREQWRTLENGNGTLGFHKRWGISLPSQRL
jgi:hypothetical protein